MTKIEDLKVGDEVVLTIKARVGIREKEGGEEYASFDFADDADYIAVGESHVKSGVVSFKRITPPLPTEPGVYVPSCNKGYPHWSVIYKFHGNEWQYSDGTNHVSGEAAHERAKEAHENLGGLVRLVPEQ